MAEPITYSKLSSTIVKSVSVEMSDAARSNAIERICNTLLMADKKRVPPDQVDDVVDLTLKPLRTMLSDAAFAQLRVRFHGAFSELVRNDYLN